jgi:hypothetical protein
MVAGAWRSIIRQVSRWGVTCNGVPDDTKGIFPPVADAKIASDYGSFQRPASSSDTRRVLGSQSSSIEQNSSWSRPMPFLTLETLLVTEKTTLSFERVEGGKIRVKASSWDDAKVILPDQVLEVRSIDGRLRFARKGRDPDQGDQPKKAFDPEEFYGSDNGPAERHACRNDGDTRVSDTVTGGDNVLREGI